MKKVLGMGNALTDILFQIENDELLNELNLIRGGMQLIQNEQSEHIKSHFSPSSATMATGGSASNTINGIAKLGLESGFIGKVSNDEIGEFFSSNSLDNGVTPHMQLSETPSGHCTILVSPDSERTLCTFLGAASELYAKDLNPEVFNDYDFFHIEGYLVQNHELIRTALKMAKEAGLTTSIDLASFNIVKENLDFLHEITENYVDITFANEDEAYTFTNKKPLDAVQEIAKMSKIAIVKIGKNGSVIQSGDEFYMIEPNLVKSVDTTGAGDLYAAGFLYGLANDYTLDICGKIGSFVSSKVVEVVGTKMSEETWSEINDKVKLITGK
ncbi:MAG: adenosine kinase [Porphyromonadaceae bacterium]|nr:adenosine kinase [Porphyromonadaceae bacterium]